MNEIEWAEFHEEQGFADANLHIRVNSKELAKFNKLCKSKRFNKSGVLRVLMRRWMEIYGREKRSGPAGRI